MFRYVAAAFTGLLRGLQARALRARQRPLGRLVGTWHRSSNDWPSAGQRPGPTHQRRLPATAAATPQTRQYASLPIRAPAPRALPETQSARAHAQETASHRQEPHRALASWPKARGESWGQPAAVVVARTRLKAPVPHYAYRPELSPRHLPVGVAIAIGPWWEKTGSWLHPGSTHPWLRRQCPRTSTHYSKTRSSQHQSIARTTCTGAN